MNLKRQKALLKQGRNSEVTKDRESVGVRSFVSAEHRNGKAAKVAPAYEIALAKMRRERDVWRETRRQMEGFGEHYASLFDLAPVGYATLNKAGGIMNINQAGARLLGRSCDRLVRRPLMQFVARRDRQKLRRHFELCEQRRGDQLSTELWLNPNSQGRSLCVELISGAPDRKEADPLAYNSVLIDVTRRKEAEAELRAAHDLLEQRVEQRTAQLVASNRRLVAEIAERKHIEQSLRETQEVLEMSERNLADFFDNAPIGLLWVGPKGQIRRVNQAGLELFDCKAKECLQRRIQEFYLHPEMAASDLRRLARQETLERHQIQLRRKDGRVRYVLIDANGLWEGGRMRHTRWFVRDVTRRVELEREILRIAEHEQQRLGRDLHDDLCQQLTGIEFFSQTLARHLARESPDSAGRAREIARMVRHAITHTRELAHGLSPVELEACGLTRALQELAESTCKLFKVRCRFSPRDRAFNRDPAAGIHLYRIAQEAVANAIKHGHARRVEIQLRHHKNRLELTVKDDGSGLPVRLRNRRSMGLRLMQYRAGVINGTLKFKRPSAGGTIVACSVPDSPDHFITHL